DLHVTGSRTFDAFNRETSHTDTFGNTVTTTYDALGRPVGASGATYPTRNEYDTANRTTALSTTRDGTTWDVTSWGYDLATGLATNKVYADGSAVSYAYTPDGKLAARAWARGLATAYAYNPDGLLTGVSYSDGLSPLPLGEGQGEGAAPYSVTLAYDAFQRLASASNAIAQYSFANDNLGTATNETVTLGGTVSTLTRDMDNRHRLAALRVGDAPPVQYSYDIENRLSMVSNAAFVAEYAYTSDGWDAGYSMALTNGVVLDRNVARDPYRRSLINAITNNVNGTATAPLVYDYDKLNRVTSCNADTFGYNARSEVTAADIGATASRYTYDHIGNNIWTSCNGATNNYTANSLNQYTSFSNLVQSCNPVYDLDGNLLTNGVWSYAYDAENRLTAAYSNNVCVVSNAYDHMSRRVLKWTPCHTTTFVYDGWLPIFEIVATASEVATNAYVWGKDLSGTMQGAGGVGGLLAVWTDETWYFPFYDNNGNITAYVNEQGVVVAKYVYDVYGGTIAKSGAMADTFAHRFSTKYFDAETGLYYYGYRFYDPVLHRWLNRDPIEEKGGLNLYVFCKNSPYNLFDILGREPEQADENSNAEAEANSKYVRVPVKFRVWAWELPLRFFRRNLFYEMKENKNGGVVRLCLGNGRIRIAMYPGIGFPPEATPDPKIKVDYNINPPQYTGSGNLAPRVNGCPQPNGTGLSPRELFGMPTSMSGNYSYFPEKIGNIEYGNARFELYREITKNGLLIDFKHKMFRNWVIDSSCYPPTDDIYAEIDVAIGDVVEVKMGNGDGFSASHDFWTKYKIGAKSRR
ncbi:MAG: RHS repeat-associated core domain-containing protein, partial [Kiritimatiellia bacterium]